MRVHKLQIQNFMRIKGLTIEPDPDENVVYLSGANGSGKTSTTEAVWAVIGGTKVAEPVRKGERSAVVSVDLGDITVTRVWDESGTAKARVAGKDGVEFKRPMSVLKGFFGAVCPFDMSGWLSAHRTEQVTQLLQISGVDPQALAALDIKRENLYNARRDIGRDEKRVKGAIEEMPELPDDLPDGPLSTEALTADLTEAYAERRAKESALRDVAELRRERDRVSLEIASNKEEMARLRARNHDLHLEIEDLEVCIISDTKSAEGMPDPDIESAQVALAGASGINEQIKRRDELRRLETELAQYRSDYDSHTAKIDAIDSEKAAILAKVTSKIDPDLSVVDGYVRYKGSPLEQASSAERIKLVMQIGMAASKRFRALRIKDGSLLDRESLALVERLADEHDYQVFIECVDETGDVGFMIVDGELA